MLSSREKTIEGSDRDYYEFMTVGRGIRELLFIFPFMPLAT